MCYYRYYYFPGCRHQKTVLFDFCDKAEPLAPSEIMQEATGKTIEQAPPKEKEERRGRCRKAHSHLLENLPSSRSLHNNTSISRTGSASITEEPLLEEASSSTPAQTVSHSSTATTDDMAGWAPFGTTLRSWMSEKSSSQTESSASGSAHAMGILDGNFDSDTSPKPHATRRKPGIREYTNESCDLADTSLILQHLAESSRDVNPQHVGTDDRRMMSYSSVVAGGGQDESTANRDSLDQIEADIEALKVEVSKIRVDNSGTTHHPEHGDGNQSFALDGEVPLESAAARLQKAHEKVAKTLRTGKARPQKVLPSTQSLRDFPTLGGSDIGGLKGTAAVDVSHDDHGITRKPSYARAALAGWKDDIEQNRSAGTSKLVPSDSLKTELFQQEVVVVSKDSMSTADGKPMKEEPRFAQPTTSSTRRTDDTVRQSSASASPRETSPTKKTVRAVELKPETTKRTTQSHQYRKSLPSGWVSPDKKAGIDETAPSTSLTGQFSPASDRYHAVNAAHTRSKSHEARAHEAAATRQVKKKTSNYMLPTEAATQRAIATLGQENVKRNKSRVKPSVLRVDTPNQYATLVSPQSSQSSAWTSLPGSAVELQDSNPFATPETSMTNKTDGFRFRGHRIGDKVKRDSSPPVSAAIGMEGKVFDDSKSPSKIARSIAHTRARSKTFAGESSTHQADLAMPEALRLVANTTTRRRTSHADILRPIIVKLDNKGLWRVKPNSFNVSANVDDGADQPTDGTSTDVAIAKRMPRRTSVAEKLEEVALLARQGLGIRKAMPPHLRGSRQSSVASTVTESTIIEVGSCKQLYAREEVTTQANNMSSQNKGSPRAKPSEGIPLQKALSLPAHSAPSSLRATAIEFKPIWKPETVAHELRLLSWEGSLDADVEQTECTMPEDVKWSVKRIQEWKRGASPSKSADRRLWGDLMHEATGSDVVPRMDEALGPQYPTAGFDSLSRNVVRAGQTLRPTVSPGKKTVQWIMQDTNGEQVPVSFGRAPPPPDPPASEMRTPSLSPNSDDTSPMVTPYTPSAWTSAGMSENGWLGGDGKEIRFVGEGHYTEIDPNSPVNTHFSTSAGSAGVYGRRPCPRYGSASARTWDKPNAQPASKVWPRSRRQWAELASYPKVPCGDVEYMQAAEVLPHAIASVTHCFDCVH